MALFYKEFETRKIRWTNGKPVAVVKGGLLNAWHLVIARKSDELYIPEYLLYGASKTVFNEMKRKKEAKK